MRQQMALSTLSGLALLFLQTSPVTGNACGGLEGVYICNPYNPSLFDICIGDQKYSMNCPGGLHFNTHTQMCDWPQNADCGKPAGAGDSAPSVDTAQAYPTPLPTQGYKELETNPNFPPRQDDGWNYYYYDDDEAADAGEDDRVTSRPPVTVRHLGPDDFRRRDDEAERDDGGRKYFRASDSKTAVTGPLQHDSRKSDNNYNSRNYNSVEDDDNRAHRAAFSKTKGRRSSPSAQKTADETGRTRNPYFYAGERGEKHRRAMLEQKYRNERARNRYRKADDGYDKRNNNRRSSGKVAPKNSKVTDSSKKRRWWHKAETRDDDSETTPGRHNILSRDRSSDAITRDRSNNDLNANGRQNLYFGDNNDIKDDNTNKKNDKKHSQGNSLDRGANTRDEAHKNSFHARNNKNRNTRNKLFFSSSSNNNNEDNHINNGNDNNSHNLDDNGVDMPAEADADSEDPAAESQDRFTLAHFPWWSSKSATPRVLRQKFAPPTPQASRSHPRRGPHRRRQKKPAVSRAAAATGPSRQRATGSASRRTETGGKGLSLSFPPAAAPVKRKDSGVAPIPPQQPMSAKKSITAAAASAPKPKRGKKPRKTGKCSEDVCQLPECRCVGTDIPGGLPVADTPQMVMLTFDDSVNVANFDYYTKLFDGKFRNPNGCPVKGTFFVSGDATQYHLVKKLHKMAQEIASHSISHRSPTTYWAHAGYDAYVAEIEGMRKKLTQKSGVPREAITGMRVPFLQVGGDDQYRMLEDYGYRYDTSMVTGNLYRNEDPPVWPFTLDYPPSSKHCSLTPCPTASYPGLWEVPLVRWYGSNRLACAMPDGCTIEAGQKGTFRFLMDNFNRHYGTNRSPLGIFLHASWFRRKDGNLEGLMQFLEEMSLRKDVWVVSVSQVLDWVQNPVPNKMSGSLATWDCES